MKLFNTTAAPTDREPRCHSLYFLFFFFLSHYVGFFTYSKISLPSLYVVNLFGTSGTTFRYMVLYILRHNVSYVTLESLFWILYFFLNLIPKSLTCSFSISAMISFTGLFVNSLQILIVIKWINHLNWRQNKNRFWLAVETRPKSLFKCISDAGDYCSISFVQVFCYYNILYFFSYFHYKNNVIKMFDCPLQKESLNKKEPYLEIKKTPKQYSFHF